jgi:hypothetical protein
MILSSEITVLNLNKQPTDPLKTAELADVADNKFKVV